MDTWTWVLIGVAAIFLATLVVGLGAAARRRRGARRDRSEELERRFGDEYHRVVAEKGRGPAERELGDRLDAYDSLDLRRIEPELREQHTEEWRVVQFGFVDSPERAVREAEHLVVTVMDDRGYPTSDVVARLDMMSVESVELADRYRRAHRIFRRADAGVATIAELRDALLEYRDLFEALLGRAQREPTTFEAGPPERDLPSEATPMRPV
jgi:hypothetical protein